MATEREITLAKRVATLAVERSTFSLIQYPSENIDLSAYLTENCEVEADWLRIQIEVSIPGELPILDDHYSDSLPANVLCTNFDGAWTPNDEELKTR